MTGQIVRLEQLEARFERLRNAELALEARMARAEQQIRDTQTSSGGGSSGGGGFVYFVNPIVISAGGNVTGQTIYWNLGGTVTATGTTSATVYNIMPSATVATSGHYIVVQPNPDGTYTAVTQGC